MINQQWKLGLDFRPQKQSADDGVGPGQVGDLQLHVAAQVPDQVLTTEKFLDSVWLSSTAPVLGSITSTSSVRP